MVGSLGDKSREQLLKLGTKREYHSGSVLFCEEGPASFAVVLLDGFVKVTRGATTGNPVLLAIKGAGDIVGLDSLPGNRLRRHTVTAAGRVDCQVLRTVDFCRALQMDPSLAQALIGFILAEVYLAEDRRVEAEQSSVMARVASVLLDLATKCGKQSGDRIDIAVPVTQAELATLAGVSLATAQRTLRYLRAAGFIETRRQRVSILNPRDHDPHGPKHPLGVSGTLN
jgi:CRP-like cAMP-binding protein